MWETSRRPLRRCACEGGGGERKGELEGGLVCSELNAPPWQLRLDISLDGAMGHRKLPHVLGEKFEKLGILPLNLPPPPSN